MTDRRLLTRIALRNYKSIGACDIRPAQLSFLVGPNGSGKSNFLDALRFVADSLSYSIDHALRDRGGIGEVRRRSGGHPNHFGIRLEFDLAEWRGHYSFTVGAMPRMGYEIQSEECLVVPHDGDGSHYYRVERGRVRQSTFATPPVAASDRLYLVTVSGLDAFRAVYEALSTMGFYNLNPDAIGDLQLPDPGILLKRDGSNLASVLSTLAGALSEAQAKNRGLSRQGGAGCSRRRPALSRAERSPGVPTEGPRCEGSLACPGRQHVRRDPARPRGAGGALPGFRIRRRVSKPCRYRRAGARPFIPPPPGFSSTVFGDAAGHAQILVTSHSPDLLDNNEISADSIVAVVVEHGETRIGPLDEVGRSALRERLYTAGELLRNEPSSTRIPRPQA